MVSIQRYRDHSKKNWLADYEKKFAWCYRLGFWWMTLTLVSPILINWISWIVRKSGNTNNADILFDHRYASILVGGVIYAIGFTIWRVFIYPREMEAFENEFPEIKDILDGKRSDESDSQSSTEST